MPAYNNLEDILRLIQETGDRCIIIREGFDPYVIMSIDSYRSLLTAAASKQNLAGLSERELIEKINQQIAEWRERRSAKFDEYDVSQFIVGASRPERTQTSQTIVRQDNPSYQQQRGPDKQKRGVEKLNPDDDKKKHLPFVEENDVEEYKLEPLT